MTAQTQVREGDRASGGRQTPEGRRRSPREEGGQGGHMISWRWPFAGRRAGWEEGGAGGWVGLEGWRVWGWGGGGGSTSPLPSQIRGIVVESAAALFHSALQTLGSEYCVARWGKPAERGRERQRQQTQEEHQQ